MGFISVVDKVCLILARQSFEIGFCSSDNRCAIASRFFSKRLRLQNSFTYKPDRLNHMATVKGREPRPCRASHAVLVQESEDA